MVSLFTKDTMEPFCAESAGDNLRGIAILSNEKKYTIFEYNKYRIRFIVPYSLEYYTEVKEWDKGYLVAMAKYKHNKELEEEYIDLVPILQKLYLNADEFLKPIEGVQITNG